MKSAKDLINEGNSQWNRVKTEVDDLGLQLALGRHEAREVFEREWKRFSGFLEDQSHRLRRQSYWATHLLSELKQHATALKTILKQAAPDSEKVFVNWREGVLRTVYELEFIIDQLYPVLDQGERDLVSTFRIKMEVYRTRLLIIPFSELQTLQQQAVQLVDKIDDVMVWLDRDSESAREKVQRFGKEIGVSFDHMKQAFGELFK